MSPRKKLIFAVMAILMGLSAALLGGETFLRIRKSYFPRTEVMEKGLIVYDERLGWKLAPSWRGWHRHSDFNVEYSTNRYGFRGDFGTDLKRGGSVFAFVGDSFTFALGVKDSETFVERLNTLETEGGIYMNFGIPGFSTDQECLLIEERVFDFGPRCIFLVVYLGNDLIDNELPFPIHADHGKPFFEMTSQGLTLRNTPVPFLMKPREMAQTDLRGSILGLEPLRQNFINRWLERFEVFRIMKVGIPAPADLPSRLEKRLAQPVVLFQAIVERIQEACRKRKTGLCLVLMPGKSFVEHPDSISARFQDHLREEILAANLGKREVPVIDLAGALRGRYQKRKGNWFYPDDGHLTPEGNRVVADILLPAIHKMCMAR